MGKSILIYDSGQTYEIDSDLIYVPPFQYDRVFQQMLKAEENRNDTESKNGTDYGSILLV